jgi:hypothetical protein
MSEEGGVSKDTAKEQGHNLIKILIIIIAIGFATTAYFTITFEYVPSSKSIIIENATNPTQNNTKDRIFEAIVSYEKNINIPALGFITPKQTTISVFFYTDRSQKDLNIRQVLLSSSDNPVSSNAPSFHDSIFKPQQQGSITWNLNTTIGHTLKIQNFTSNYDVIVLYRINSMDSGPIYKLQIPIQFNVKTMDFSAPAYFWIIFSGVLLSRIFSYSKTSNDFKSLQLNKLDLLWIPFSAIITLLIFVSFKQQVNLTSDMLMNLALAFGFGFGFDKVLETLQKK